MARLLHIDSSPRGERWGTSPPRALAHSRRLTREFVEARMQAHPADVVTYRDVGRNPVPHVDEPLIAAAFTPPEKRTSEMWETIRVTRSASGRILGC